MKSAARLSDDQRTMLEVYSRSRVGLVPEAIQAILASHDALLGCLEEAVDWLDADLAHAPDAPTAMADRELIQRWRAALERAL
jgi:hypothetical protein